MYNYSAKVVRVVDGDTVDFDVDLGFKTTLRLRGRLVGVDTPERGHADWGKAKDMLSDLLTEHADEDGRIQIHTHKTGKYGRWLVDIDNVNKTLSEILPYG